MGEAANRNGGDDAHAGVISESPSGEVTRLAPGIRHGRRLSDKILVAFHHACDSQDLDVAEQLLRILERMMQRPEVPPEQNRRRGLESLVAAHERLWHLRHRDS